MKQLNIKIAVIETSTTAILLLYFIKTTPHAFYF